MRLHGVAADADDASILSFELFVDIAELRGLARAARGVVLRIEIQDQRAAEQIRGRERCAPVVEQRDVGKPVAFTKQDFALSRSVLS